MEVGQRQTLFCKHCAKGTEHVILYADQREETQSDESGQCDLDHHINRGFMECTVCERPKIRLKVFTYPLDDETNISIPREPVRPLPTWIGGIPSDMREVLLEVHAAFSEKHNWLVSSGVRTLIELFSVERIGRNGDIETKLKRLQTEGFISAKELLLMQQSAEFGSGATERRQRPTDRECTVLLDMTEHLLQKLTFGNHAETLGRVVALDVKATKRN